jgi:hypothetical protein
MKKKSYSKLEGDVIMLESAFLTTPSLVINVRSYLKDRLIDVDGTEYTMRDLRLNYDIKKAFLMRKNKY